ncbi:hypothetical protein WMW72_27255 [Paenibacillus filicis]|uniref:Copper resistance protein D domain-containing protein n=1 Tax=Paenibacillus filicis TaxID=669464 RepID=A0ABU9DU57_9BACL
MAVAMLLAACLYVLSAPGWEVLASGHEHINAGASGEWEDLLGKWKSLAETSAVMLLIGVYMFRTALLPTAGGWGVWPAIERMERITAVVMLYVIILAGSNNSLTVVKAVIAIMWLLAAWGAIPYAKSSTIVKGLCALVMVPLLHIEDVGSILSIPGMIAVLAASIHTVSGAIWAGGGISIYTALALKPELPASQFKLLLERFRIGAATACCGILLSSLLILLLGSSTGEEWKSGSESIWLMCKLLLILVIVWIAKGGYGRWRQAGDDELRLRYRYKQRLRVSLGLTVPVLLISALTSPPIPGGATLKETIYWHVMGEEAHMSLRIREQNAGRQQVRLDIWLPAGMGKPIAAEVTLHHGEEAAEVPLIYKEGGPDPYGYEGFDKYTYEANGRYMTKSGSWTMQVIAIDRGQKKHTYEKVEDIPTENVHQSNELN